jgi:hypothetical protein
MDRRFATDGCSGGMSAAWLLAFGNTPPWEGCCIEHDVKYWAGGDSLERLQVDQELRRHVLMLGYRAVAWAMFLAVRIGGSPYLPLPWRWGYGWRFGRMRGYRALSAIDRARRDAELAMRKRPLVFSS